MVSLFCSDQCIEQYVKLCTEVQVCCILTVLVCLISTGHTDCVYFVCMRAADTHSTVHNHNKSTVIIIYKKLITR